MKTSKFTDAHKAFNLKQGADGHPVTRVRAPKACNRHTQANAILFIDDVILNFTFRR